MWWRVLRDLDPRVTANCKSTLQTSPLVREGVPQHEDRKCPTVIKNPVVGPKWGPNTKTNWPTDRRSQYNLNLNLVRKPRGRGTSAIEAVTKTRLVETWLWTRRVYVTMNYGVWSGVVTIHPMNPVTNPNPVDNYSVHLTLSSEETTKKELLPTVNLKLPRVVQRDSVYSNTSYLLARIESKFRNNLKGAKVLSARSDV
jgi:hypothetical protein